MNKGVKNRVAALNKKAKEGGNIERSSVGTRNRSSLHKIIKTKEQADTFMKLLSSL